MTQTTRLRRPGRDDIQDAIEAGIEAAQEVALNDNHCWLQRDYLIAETAARAAVDGLYERMTDKPYTGPSK